MARSLRQPLHFFIDLSLDVLLTALLTDIGRHILDNLEIISPPEVYACDLFDDSSFAEVTGCPFLLDHYTDQRLKLCQQIEKMVEEARASRIVERIIFGGSFVTGQTEPNDFDCIVVLRAGTRYENLKPFQRWVADTREASRRYEGDVFVARADQPMLAIYLEFFAMNRLGKIVGLVEVRL